MHQALATNGNRSILFREAAGDRRYATGNPKHDSMKFRSAAISALVFAAFASAGTSCKRKEKVLDVDTPAGGLEIQRDKKSGEIELKVEEKK